MERCIPTANVLTEGEINVRVVNICVMYALIYVLMYTLIYMLIYMLMKSKHYPPLKYGELPQIL